MASPTVKIKRSGVSAKRPTIENLNLGELGLNFYDGYLFAQRDTGGVGIGTTISLLTPWTENFGGNSIYYLNSVGIGTINSNDKLSVYGNVNISGVVTASAFVGDGSGLTGIVASGSGVFILDDTSPIGTASSINFGTNLSVSPVSAGIVTVNGTSLTVKELSSQGGSTNVTVSNVTEIQFNNGNGFNVTDEGSGVAFVDLGSTFNPWQLSADGGSVSGGTLSALGEEDIELIAGNGIHLLSNPSGTPKSLKFIATHWVTTSAGIHTLTNVGVGTTNPSSKLDIVGDVNVSGVVTALSFSGNASSATYATSAGIATYATTSGIATYATTAGIATYATTAGIATYATAAGIATYATTAGVSTYAITAGIATYATAAGIATYATTAGVSTYAITAGVATALQNARTFEITGDIIASPISFNGTGNVSLAATIQPNSVSLGSDTTGDYVQSITGTTNQITVTGGTGEGSTPTLSIPNQFTVPQDLTVLRDVQIDRNLNVNGNITIGGTSATIFSQSLNIFDPDIVLGFRTDGSGNDISNDNTANHGGVAVASTEGTPLVQLFIAGIETNPATYKKIMWFKAGTFTGLGTDAWLSNYAIGIGSTQFPSGTRLAAGAVQITERDLAVVRNINASGIITGTLANTLTLNTSGTGLSGSTTYNNSGATTFTVTSNATSNNTPSTIVARDGSGNFSAGTITANLTGTASTASFATTAFNLSDAANITTGTINSARLSGTYDIDTSGNAATATYATSSGIATYATTSGISTSVIGGIASVSQLNVTGVSTFVGIISATSIQAQVSITNSGNLNANRNVLLATTTSGNSPIIGDVDLTYNTLTNILTSGSFSGSGSLLANLNASNVSSGTLDAARLSGTYNINISGIATYATIAGIATYATTSGIATYATTAGIATYATTAGIATYATTAGIVTVTTSSTNSAFKVPFANTTDNTTGNYGLLQDDTATFTYNPSTNTLVVGTFSGSGASLTSLNATNISSGTIPGDRGVTSGSTSSSFIEYNGTTSTSGQFDGGTTTPSGTQRLNYGGYLYATRFYGDGSNLSSLSASNISSGTISDDRLPDTITSDITGNAGTATTATNADNINISATPSDTTTYPVFVANSTTGNQTPFVDSGISWNASSNILTVPTIQVSTGIDLDDSDYIYFGTSDDVKVFYDGTANDLEIELETTANKIAITNNGTYTHLITRDGKVGINTSVTPTKQLEVNGDVRIAGGIYDSNNNVGTAGSVLSSTGSGLSWISGAQTPTTVSTASTGANLTHYMTFVVDNNTSAASEFLRTDAGVTYNPSTNDLTVSGAVTANSDERLKTNIKTIENALDKVNALRGVEFDMIETGKHNIGVIAQEVEKILPDLVSENSHGIKSVAYANMVGLLIEAIKEQQVQIEDLKQKLLNR